MYQPVHIYIYIYNIHIYIYIDIYICTIACRPSPSFSPPRPPLDLTLFVHQHALGAVAGWLWGWKEGEGGREWWRGRVSERTRQNGRSPTSRRITVSRRIRFHPSSYSFERRRWQRLSKDVRARNLLCFCASSTSGTPWFRSGGERKGSEFRSLFRP